MPIEKAGYRRWVGTRLAVWRTAWPIARTALLLVLRRRLFWCLLGLALINFLFHMAVIYLKAQLTVQRPQIGRFLDQFLVTGRGDTYRDFMTAQGVVTMLLLAFAGAQVVGGDYERGTMAFYLSRRLGRRHYVMGKLLAVGSLVALITALPALLLYAEYGMLSNGLEYFRAESQILWGILGYGAVLVFVLSTLVSALAAVLRRAVPLAMVWTGLFVFLPVLSELLRTLKQERMWRLLDLWRNMELLGEWCFQAVDGQQKFDRLPWAAAICATICVVSLAVFGQRVRAVEVVQ
jgi:ABC-type transport system involved in multi-copper enzyme maturation permease subunit